METGPTVAALHLARAKVRYSQGAYEPALADLDETIRRMPNLIAAHFFHALSLLALGRCQEGETEIHAPGMPAWRLSGGAGAVSRRRRQGRLRRGLGLTGVTAVTDGGARLR